MTLTLSEYLDGLKTTIIIIMSVPGHTVKSCSLNYELILFTIRIDNQEVVVKATTQKIEDRKGDTKDLVIASPRRRRTPTIKKLE